MTTDTDVAGRRYVEVPFPGGVARLTLVPADQSLLKTLSLHLEARLLGQDPRPAVEIPASAAGELFAAALQLVGTVPAPPVASLQGPPATSATQVELAKAAPHLPHDFMLQPSLPGHAVYWCQLGPHRVMKLEFRGFRPRRARDYTEALQLAERELAQARRCTCCASLLAHVYDRLGSDLFLDDDPEKLVLAFDEGDRDRFSATVLAACIVTSGRMRVRLPCDEWDD